MIITLKVRSSNDACRTRFDAATILENVAVQIRYGIAEGPVGAYKVKGNRP